MENYYQLFWINQVLPQLSECKIMRAVFIYTSKCLNLFDTSTFCLKKETTFRRELKTLLDVSFIVGWNVAFLNVKEKWWKMPFWALILASECILIQRMSEFKIPISLEGLRIWFKGLALKVWHRPMSLGWVVKCRHFGYRYRSPFDNWTEKNNTF